MHLHQLYCQQTDTSLQALLPVTMLLCRRSDVVIYKLIVFLTRSTLYSLSVLYHIQKYIQIQYVCMFGSGMQQTQMFLPSVWLSELDG